LRRLGSETSCIGINIPSGGRFEQLTRHLCASATKRCIGWFGYESPSAEPPRLSIWFYPEDESAKDPAMKYVEQVTRHRASGYPDSGLGFYITPNATSELDDVS